MFDDMRAASEWEMDEYAEPEFKQSYSDWHKDGWGYILDKHSWKLFVENIP